MEKILITAFEPFGGNERNASLEVLKRLPDDFLGIPAGKLTLPVRFHEAADLVLKHPAGCIFLIGEAGGRQEVTPELRAVNFRNARIPDNAGFQPKSEKILDSGPDEYRTRIPAETIVEGMRSEGYPVAVSEDAGTYVCNDTFYLVGTGSRVPVEFIHVPAVPDDAENFAQTVGAYILRAVESLLKPASPVEGRRGTALTIADDGIRLSAVLEKPEKEGETPLCVFLHGFGSDKNSPHQVAAAAAMRECGFATLRFDLYGHGASGGFFRDHTLFKWITNTLAVIDFARKELGFRDIWLSGHSQGGLVAAVAAGMEADRIRGLILRAPAFMLPDWARLGNKTGLPFDPARVPETVKIFDGRELGGNYIRVAQALSPDETIRRFTGPVLIIQGEDDDVVRADVSRKAAETYADCELVLIKGEGHHFDRHRDEMISVIKNWTVKKAGVRS